MSGLARRAVVAGGCTRTYSSHSMKSKHSARPAGASLRQRFPQRAFQPRGIFHRPQGSFKAAAGRPMSTLKKPQVKALFFPEHYPSLEYADSNPFTAGSDLLAIAVPEDAFTGGSQDADGAEEEGEPAPVAIGSELAELDSQQFGGLLAALLNSNDFKGKKGSLVMGPWLNGASKSVALAVFGKPDDSGSSRAALKGLGKQLAAAAGASKFQTMRVLLWDKGETKLQADDLEGLAAGIVLSGSDAASFTKKDTTKNGQKKQLQKVLVHTDLGSVAEKLQAGAAFAKGTLLARYLVDTPPNICTPSHITEAAKRVQESAPDVFQLKVLEKDECSEMGLYLGVAECSEEDPKFIHLTYTSPGNGDKKIIGLVGKGLTFDSGGYNLKVGGMIELMKFDMGGAAAVFGAALAIGQLKPPGLEIHFISASCENMISGRGLRPGDILSSANGKTVEVDNTDAEGRLTLADALWYAQGTCKVSKVVDVATLTGACIVALGTEIGGLFSPSKELAGALKSVSEASGEKIWELPMHDSYWKGMKSEVADMRNTGGRFGGAITASLFLKQYVDTKSVQWAHLDIAGPAWGFNEKPQRATGFGAELLAKWALSESSS